MRPITTGGALIAAASSARPGPTTLSLTSPRSGSSVGPSSAASSTSTSGPHRSPGQGQWPSSGTPQAAANYCWFADPAKALCLRLAGTPDADKPLAGLCDSARCPQATHHPCHRDVWADHAASTAAFLGTLGPTRRTEKTRLQREHARCLRVLQQIDSTATTKD